MTELGSLVLKPRVLAKNLLLLQTVPPIATDFQITMKISRSKYIINTFSDVHIISYFSSFCCSSCCLVTKSCLTLCDPMDYSPPGSSVHGISQARILEWDAIFFSMVLPFRKANYENNIWFILPKTAECGREAQCWGGGFVNKMQHEEVLCDGAAWYLEYTRRWIHRPT